MPLLLTPLHFFRVGAVARTSRSSAKSQFSLPPSLSRLSPSHLTLLSVFYFETSLAWCSGFNPGCGKGGGGVGGRSIFAWAIRPTAGPLELNLPTTRLGTESSGKPHLKARMISFVLSLSLSFYPLFHLSCLIHKHFAPLLM